MNILHLRYFLDVCETLNISKSANRLHISQPALSKQIKNLEQQVGQLFLRQHQALALTELGHFFEKRAHAILELFDATLTDVQNFLPVQDNHLTIKIKRSSALLPRIVSQIQDNWPNLTIDFVQDTHDYTPSYDFTLTTKPLPDHQNYHLFSEKILFAHALNDPKYSHVSEISPQQLNDIKVVLCAPNPLRDLIDAYFLKKQLHYDLKFETDDQNVLCQFVESNFGYSFFPEFSWQTTNKKLCLKPVIDDNFKRDIYLAVPNSHARPAISDIVTYLVSFLKNSVNTHA